MKTIKITVVDNSISPDYLASLAANPHEKLDATNLDLVRLPQHVKAELHTEASIFNAPHLRTATFIYAPLAGTFDVPQLRTSGCIYARRAKTFNAPHLLASGDIYAYSALRFNAPELRHAGYIDARHATSFNTSLVSTDFVVRQPRPASSILRRLRAALHL